MLKWMIIVIAVLAAAVFGVKYGVEYAGTLGKDTVKLKDGTVLNVPLTEYKDDVFHYKQPDLSIVSIPVAEVVGIEFSRVEKSRLDKHRLTFRDGAERRCRMIRYSRGELTLVDPAGQERTGKLSAISHIDFRR